MNTSKTILTLDSKNRDFVRQCARGLVQQARDTNCNVAFTLLEDQTVAGVDFRAGDKILIDPGKPIQEDAIVCTLVDYLPVIDLANAPGGNIVGPIISLIK